MSAEVVNALHAQAHALDAEADNTETTAREEGHGINYLEIGRHPGILRTIAKEFHELAGRMQGLDPATVNARAESDRQMAEAGGSVSGLAVQRDDTLPQAAPEVP